MTEEERYAKVEADKQNAINKSNQIYNDLLNSNSQLAQQQKDYINNWQTTQNELADKNANYQIELQNQNKQKAEDEFKNESIASKNAYYDFINPYGANAEIQAKNGLNNTGYSETTKLGAWNTQQNRTAKARASMNDAITQYNNSIKEIELNRDTTKSQYALQALQQQLEAAMQEFNTSSQLKQNQLSNNQSLESEYNNRYDTVWNQINTEKQQAEAIRQYEQNYALQQKQYQEDIRQFDENIAYLKAKDEKEYQLQIQQLEEQKRQAQIEQANWEKEYQLSLQQLSLDQYKTYSQNSSSKYSTGVVSYGALVDSYGDGNGNMIYIDSNGNKYKMKEGYNPYTGTKNPDVENGSWGSYQPNNVNGNKLSKSGKTVNYNNQSQNVWKCTDGNYYLWDGTQNKYLKLNSSEKSLLGL